MESLIPLIIMLIVGSLFSNKRKKPEDEQKPAKPFTTQSEQADGPVKRLKEMYQEIQQELGEEKEQPRPSPRPVVQPYEVKVTPERVEVSTPRRSQRTDSSRTRQSTRIVQQQVKTQKQVRTQKNLLPKTQDDIMKGVIFSEIFGPPKSKR